MPFKALVVGGGGEMGQWCARLLKNSGFDVAISSRRDVSSAAAQLGVGIVPQSAAGGYDVVVLSVPIDAVEVVAAAVGPLLKPGALLMDLASLKEEPVASMARHAAPGAEVVGAHPLFGPGLVSIEGRTIVLVPSARSERWLPVIRDVFEGAGACVLVTDAARHDRMMAVVQGLTHFMYIAWGQTIESPGVSLKDVDAFRTPVYGITREMAGRVLSQSPELYALIQSGGEVSRVRQAFIESCDKLASLAAAGDRSGFEAAFRSAASHYGDTAEARRRSERLILRDVEEVSSVVRSMGQERAFCLATGRKVYGLVRETRRDDFTLETPSETLVLRYDAVTPLGTEELARLKGSSPRVSRDLLVKLPIGADARVLQWVLSRIDGVAAVGYETYDALNSHHVVFRFTVEVAPGTSEETLQRVLRTVWGLGYEVK